jgi:hypothetical protein
MSRAATEMVQNDISARVGVSASYTYGPGSSVSVDACMDVGQVQSKAPTEAQADARDVTTRTTSRMTERVPSRPTTCVTI